MQDIREIASLLDETIEKGCEVDRRRRVKIVREKDEIRKALSFDPTKVQVMSPELGYYNPYRMLEDGTFAPLSRQHWSTERSSDPEISKYHKMVRCPSGYRESEAMITAMKSLVEDTIGEVCKAGFPVGTIHTYGGAKYKKQANGDWIPVQDKASGHPVERHATEHLKKLQEELARRKSDTDTKGSGKRGDKAVKPKKADKEEAKQTKPKKADKEEAKQTKPKKTEPKKTEPKKTEPKKTEPKKTEPKKTEPKKKVEPKQKVEPKKEYKKLPSEEGLPDNNLGPPPPEREVFLKPGRELNIDAIANFISEFYADFKKTDKIEAELKDAGATHYASRLKDEKSLLGKMHGRFANRSLNTVNDVIGARGLARDIFGLEKMLHSVQKNLDVISVDDSTRQGRRDGYRAIHIAYKTETGKLVELQLKTQRQQIFSGYCHDAIYKEQAQEGKTRLKGNPEVESYLRDVSDYLYKLDSGVAQYEIGKPPEAPAIMNDLPFPWDAAISGKVEDYINKAEGDRGGNVIGHTKSGKPIYKQKYFVVVRNEQKENQGVKEFEKMQEALVFRKKMRSDGHIGELPLGKGSSLREFLSVFSEYKSKKGE
jgi:ppGpp synthetase/RelA/SpoT-type nucleotidyltranferase